MIELNKNDLLLVAGGINGWGAAKSAAEGVAIGLAGMLGAVLSEHVGPGPKITIACALGFTALAGVGLSYFRDNTAS